MPPSTAASSLLCFVGPTTTGPCNVPRNTSSKLGGELCSKCGADCRNLLAVPLLLSPFALKLAGSVVCYPLCVLKLAVRSTKQASSSALRFLETVPPSTAASSLLQFVGPTATGPCNVICNTSSKFGGQWCSEFEGMFADCPMFDGCSTPYALTSPDSDAAIVSWILMLAVHKFVVSWCTSRSLLRTPPPTSCMSMPTTAALLPACCCILLLIAAVAACC